MEEPTTVFICENIGVSGTTECHIQKNEDGKFEARMGLALFGGTNMDDAGFDAADHNPFHEKFYDNYASGIGETEEQAIAAMNVDMKSICDSLWL